MTKNPQARALDDRLEAVIEPLERQFNDRGIVLIKNYWYVSGRNSPVLQAEPAPDTFVGMPLQDNQGFIQRYLKTARNRALIETARARSISDNTQPFSLIGDWDDAEYYSRLLGSDPTAGQTWDGAQGMRERLKNYLSTYVNENRRLDLVEQIEDLDLIGVYETGRPALRKGGGDIVNGVINTEGKFEWIPHAQALEYVQANGAQWAGYIDLLDGAKRSGFYFPKALRVGAFAASEAVLGAYLTSPFVPGYPVYTDAVGQRVDDSIRNPELSAQRERVTVMAPPNCNPHDPYIYIAHFEPRFAGHYVSIYQAYDNKEFPLVTREVPYYDYLIEPNRKTGYPNLGAVLWI